MGMQYDVAIMPKYRSEGAAAKAAPCHWMHNRLARGVQLGPDPTHSQRFVQRPNLLQFNGLRADRRVGIRCA